jgi:predicted NAD/FAD-binding protein
MWSSPPVQAPKPRIAVIGAGISGLSAAWLLRYEFDVTIFEAASWAGGHAHTIDVEIEGQHAAVDTGFIVYNERNYPNLTALLSHLGVSTQGSDMSFAASLDGGAFEYSSSGLRGLFGHGLNLARPRTWQMLSDLLRFYRTAPLVLRSGAPCALTIGEYLAREGYKQAFIDDHLLPMAAAIWSASSEDIRNVPLLTFVRFFASHGLLELKGRPRWRTVVGGSRTYVERLVEPFARTLELGRRVTSIHRRRDHVTVVDGSCKAETFSQVVVATHADQALRLLADADANERTVLSSFKYSDNRALLHRDSALMPRRRSAWASWNYVGRGRASAPLCVTYWMNRLQNLPLPSPVFVTLNPDREIAREKVLAAFTYRHPQFDAAAIAAQGRLWHLQGSRRTWFCGSYFGYGFHEDALQSGLAVAESIGMHQRPWAVRQLDRIAQARALVAGE